MWLRRQLEPRSLEIVGYLKAHKLSELIAVFYRTIGKQLEDNTDNAVRVRFHIIRNACIEYVGESQSCMVSKLRILWKQTVCWSTRRR